jgi:hypothetical protein
VCVCVCVCVCDFSCETHRIGRIGSYPGAPSVGENVPIAGTPGCSNRVPGKSISGNGDMIVMSMFICSIDEIYNPGMSTTSSSSKSKSAGTGGGSGGGSGGSAMKTPLKAMTPSSSKQNPVATPTSASQQSTCVSIPVKIVYDSAQNDSPDKIYLCTKDMKRLNAKIGSYGMIDSCSPPVVLACWPSKTAIPGQAYVHTIWREQLKSESRSSSDATHVVTTETSG